MRPFLCLLAIVPLALAGCSSPEESSGPGADDGAGNGGGATPGPQAGGGSGASTAGSATIADFSFAPAELNVAAGAAVTWTNEGSSTHTVTADDGSFDSRSVASGATFTQTFSDPGTYPYHCEIHPGMKGTVTVG